MVSKSLSVARSLFRVCNLSGPSPEHARNLSLGDAIGLNFLLDKGTVAREMLPSGQSLLEMESKVWAVKGSRRFQCMQKGTVIAV